MRKSKKLFLFALCLVFTATPYIVLAQDPAPARSETGQGILDFLGKTGESGGFTTAPETDVDINTAIANVLNIVLGLVGVAFFIQMFYAGIRWMSAGGNSETIEKSKQSIKISIIGITIALSSFLIVNFVLNQIEKIADRNAPPAATNSLSSPPL